MDGTWDGTVTFDGGTPARSVQVPVKPNLETTVAVRFALRGGLGRMWVPAGGGILGYTEQELLVDHASQTGVTASGARAVAFDADGNLWATFSDGVRMYTPDSLADPNAQPAKTVALNDATGIAIRGDTIAVASCAGNSRVHVLPHRSDADCPRASSRSTCPWGISYDTGNNGKLWVASKQAGANGHVYRFPAAGGTAEGGVGAAVPDAYGVAVDPSGNVWVSSCSGNLVQTADPRHAGTPLSLTDFPCPGGLAFDKQGGLWVLSAGAGNGTSGSLVSISGGTPTSQLNSLSQVTFGGIAFDPAATNLPVHQ